MPSLQPKTLTLHDESRQALLRGVNKLADVVGATLGPKGKNVILDTGPFTPPRSSRDGVTVAKHIALADPLENMGAQLLRQVASKTADVAGDGTTTATVLAQAMFREGVRLVAAGANPASLKRGIDAAVQAVCGVRDDHGNFEGGTLAGLTIPVTDPKTIAQVGTLSANSDPAIGEMVAEAIARVGKDGTVTVEESQSMETTLDVVEGMQFNQGYLSPYFVTDGERMEGVLVGDDTAPLFVYLHEKRLSYLQDILPIATNIVGPSRGSLLVVAEDVADGALSFLVVNKMQGRLNAVAVKTPGFGDRRKAMLEDLAVLTGATVITPELGIKPESITKEMLGQAARITVTKDDTTIVGGMGNPDVIEARKADLRAQIERSTSDYDRERLQERLAKLTGGVAVVKVGGQTEAEMKERKDRAEDAMHATRAAVAEGIVPGGGTALIYATDAPEFKQAMSAADEAEQAGWRLVVQACEAPLRRIVANAGGEGGEIVAELRRRRTTIAATSSGMTVGYNAASEKFEDLIASGVIDPARVTRTALMSAGSIAGLLLTTEALVADDVHAAAEVKKALHPVMPGQPGMMGY